MVSSADAQDDSAIWSWKSPELPPGSARTRIGCVCARWCASCCSFFNQYTLFCVAVWVSQVKQPLSSQNKTAGCTIIHQQRDVNNRRDRSFINIHWFLGGGSVLFLFLPALHPTERSEVVVGLPRDRAGWMMTANKTVCAPIRSQTTALTVSESDTTKMGLQRRAHDQVCIMLWKSWMMNEA